MALRWAIFGTGAISAKFVAGLRHAPGATASLVASRSAQNGQRFAASFGIGQAVEGYAEAAASGAADIAYIGTPPSEHARHAILCLEAGMPVLIEKPFAASGTDARRIADAARASGLFCMEAMWTRFIPAARRLKAIVEAGELGDIRQFTGDFCFSNAPDPANGSFDPARGGGALAQLGIYPLSLAHWLFGAPETLHIEGRIGETGVEEDVALSLRYPGGVIGSIHTSLRATGDNGLAVLGTTGSAAFAGPIFRPYGLARRRYSPRQRPADPAAALSFKARLREQALAQRLAQWHGLLRPNAKVERHLFAGNGYHYQAIEADRCIAAGLTESPVMPLADSVALAETLDTIRTRIRQQNGTHI